MHLKWNNIATLESIYYSSFDFKSAPCLIEIGYVTDIFIYWIQKQQQAGLCTVPLFHCTKNEINLHRGQAPGLTIPQVCFPNLD